MISKTRTFSNKFKLLQDNIKKFHLSGKNSGVETTNKYSNEIDKLISNELNLDYKSKELLF